jgi:gluconate 2-dehydrogenase gamma chain
MDRQLAGAWGGGARLYRSGPFVQGKPEQGYQLPLTPREYFAAGIKAANAWSHETYGIEALTYWSAKAITEQYLKSPGPLVHA